MDQKLSSFVFSLYFMSLCQRFTVLGLTYKESSHDPAQGTLLHCPKPGSRLVIYTARFSPASEHFCDLHTCTSFSATPSTECRPGYDPTVRHRTCDRRFADADVWRLYRWCEDHVTAGQPCALRRIRGLSQGGAHMVRYYCVEDAAVVDPCSTFSHSMTNDLYHDLSFATHQQQCVCTGNVIFGEAVDWDTALVHISYLIRLNSSIVSTGAQNGILKAKLTSKHEKFRLNVTSFPDFLIVNVTRKFPSFTFKLWLRQWGPGFSGFVWLHIRERKVNISCKSSSGSTGVVGATDKATPFSSVISMAPSTASVETDWLSVSAVAAAVGVLTVGVILTVLCIVRKRRSRSNPAQTTMPPTGEERPSPQAWNSTYEESNPQFLINASPHHHPPGDDTPFPTYMEPSCLPAAPLPGTDVDDYATLQRHQGQGGSGHVDTYDHVMRGREEYQALDREAPRQRVIDNEYDSTAGYV